MYLVAYGQAMSGGGLRGMFVGGAKMLTEGQVGIIIGALIALVAGVVTSVFQSWLQLREDEVKRKRDREEQERADLKKNLVGGAKPGEIRLLARDPLLGDKVVAIGGRSVAIGGNVVGGKVITGDSNVVVDKQCPVCGRWVRDHARFCAACGHAVEAAGEPGEGDKL